MRRQPSQQLTVAEARREVDILLGKVAQGTLAVGAEARTPAWQATSYSAGEDYWQDLRKGNRKADTPTSKAYLRRVERVFGLDGEAGITIERGGRTYSGRYRLHDKGITVEYKVREKFAVIRASPAETLARIMLRELVEQPY